MPIAKNHFIPFKASIDAYTLPEHFTFPFYYQPHPLCLLAAQELQELQEHLKTQQAWQHNFDTTDDQTNAIGKMFGVLLVQNKHNKIGYLAAFSGKLAGQNHLPKFVPPVFDMLSKDSFFLTQQIEINKINKQLEELEKNPQILVLESFLQSEIDASEKQQTRHREKIIESRKRRKAQRATAKIALNVDDLLKLKERLGQESIQEKLHLRDLSIYWSQRIQQAEDNLKQLTNEITYLKNQRKELSATLQKQLFPEFV